MKKFLICLLFLCGCRTAVVVDPLLGRPHAPPIVMPMLDAGRPPPIVMPMLDVGRPPTPVMPMMPLQIVNEPKHLSPSFTLEHPVAFEPDEMPKQLPLFSPKVQQPQFRPELPPLLPLSPNDF